MATLLAKRAKTSPAKLVSASLALLEESLGGRDAIIAALTHAPKSRDVAYLLGIIGDPSTASKPLADLCAQGGITPGELIQAYTAGEINRAQALSQSKVGARLADVAADTMRRSLPEEQTCATCQGTGSVTPDPSKADPDPLPGPCHRCGATGRVIVEGDLEHKKLALEMGKMLQKGGGGGISLQVNQQVGVQMGSAGGALEKLQMATDAILYGEKDFAPSIVEAEVVEEESPAEIDAEGAIEDDDWRGGHAAHD